MPKCKPSCSIRMSLRSDSLFPPSVVRPLLRHVTNTQTPLRLPRNRCTPRPRHLLEDAARSSSKMRECGICRKNRPPHASMASPAHFCSEGSQSLLNRLLNQLRRLSSPPALSFLSTPGRPASAAPSSPPPSLIGAALGGMGLALCGGGGGAPYCCCWFGK